MTTLVTLAVWKLVVLAWLVFMVAILFVGVPLGHWLAERSWVQRCHDCVDARTREQMRRGYFQTAYSYSREINTPRDVI